MNHISDDFKHHPDYDIVNKQELMLFEHGRCHDTQLVLRNEFKFNLMMHGNHNFYKSQRMNLNKTLFEMYDIWQPSDVNSNCGQVHKIKKNSWHWKFNYDLAGFSKLFTQMVNTERNNTRRQILQNQLNHVIEKYQEWKMVKERDQLQQIKQDYDLYSEIMKYTDYKLPTKEELAEFGAVPFLGNNILFEADQYSQHFNPQCTRLLFHIPTYVEPSQFKMSHYATELNAALETLIDLVTISADITKQYVAAKLNGADTKKYCQPLSWFELGITTKAVYDEERDGEFVVIVVSAQITIMHYIFLLIQKYQHIQIQRWTQQYMANVDHRLREQKHEIATCDYNHHHLLQFEFTAKELVNHIHIGCGFKNRQIVTLQYKNKEKKKENEDNQHQQMPHQDVRKRQQQHQQNTSWIEKRGYDRTSNNNRFPSLSPGNGNFNEFRNHYVTTNKPKNKPKNPRKSRQKANGKKRGTAKNNKKEKAASSKMIWQKKGAENRERDVIVDVTHWNERGRATPTTPEKRRAMNGNWRR